jgi:PAS domain S-box-containing protein
MPEEERKQKQSLRRKAKRKLRGKNGLTVDELTRDDALNLVNELQVHQVELELQNEELMDTREKLSRARYRYTDLYDFAPVGYLTLSKYNIVREANVTVCQMLGIKRKDLLGHRFTEFIARESQDEFYRHRRSVFNTGIKQNCEVIIRLNGGGSFWASIEMARGENDLMAAVADITHHKKAQKALEDSEERFRTLSETSPVGVGVSSADGVILYTNRSYEITLGYEQGELIGRKASDLYLNPEDRLSWLDSMKKSGMVRDFDTRLKKKNGTPVWITINVSSIIYNNQQAVMGIIQDISERKKAEEEMRASEERFRRAIEEAPIPIIIQAEDGEVLQISRSWTKLTGYTQKDMLTSDAWMNRAYGEGAEKVRELMRQLFLGVVPAINIEFPIYTKDNQTRYWSFNASAPGIFRSGRRFIVGMAEDITERWKVEQMKDEFLSLVSHELRTPLTVISGSLKVALDDKASKKEVTELIQNAAENAEILADLLENMLELTRHQTGRLQITAETVDMHYLISKVIDKLRGYGAVQEFEVEIPDNLPVIQADPVRIERVLYNLLDNAVKYSPKNSSIKVRARRDGAFLVTSVTDQGAGILSEDQKNLFQMFSRLGDPAATAGTGLGLVVCQRLLEAHGGWINVESEPGKGSTFSFGLPLQLKN